jgi:hypothetical protein
MFDLLISFLTNTGYYFIAQDFRYFVMILVGGVFLLPGDCQKIRALAAGAHRLRHYRW